MCECRSFRGAEISEQPDYVLFSYLRWTQVGCHDMCTIIISPFVPYTRHTQTSCEQTYPWLPPYPFPLPLPCPILLQVSPPVLVSYLPFPHFFLLAPSFFVFAHAALPSDPLSLSLSLSVSASASASNSASNSASASNGVSNSGGGGGVSTSNLASAQTSSAQATPILTTPTVTVGQSTVL